MNRDLINSPVERQNILNNSVALKEIEKKMNLCGYSWQGENVFTITDAAQIFAVDPRTIQRVIELNRDELVQNGFQVLTGDKLIHFREKYTNISTQVRALSLFTFRSILNIGMILTNNDKARSMRSTILDITMSVFEKKTQGNYQYINQRDPEFIDVSYKNETGRRDFTKAINQYINMGAYKYEYFTNKVYQCIFLEKAKEYQRILGLSNRSNLRDTMYTEVLRCITAVEKGAAYELEKEFNRLGHKLNKDEASAIIEALATHPFTTPFIEQARTKMASRDLSFRDAEHKKLGQYITSVDPEDFERFLGEKSKSLEQQIKEHRDVFLRLKDK
ncbi:MAG: DNA-binding protein [Candidatus Fimenecus sp.]